MIVRFVLFVLIFVCMLCFCSVVVGERPYELQWAGRNKDYRTPMIDFEDLDGWFVKAENAYAQFIQSDERLLWGKFTAKLTYRSVDPSRESVITILPPEPIKVGKPFDVVRCWVWNNHWSWVRHPRPASRVDIFAMFKSYSGKKVLIKVGRLPWKGWFLCYRRLGPSQIKLLGKDAEFLGFLIKGKLYQDDDSVVFFDNFSVLKEEFHPLKFKLRPKRGIDMFPGQGVGINKGNGRLPFPTRKETILPSNLYPNSQSVISLRDKTVVCEYAGPDGKVVWEVLLKCGPFDGIRFRWENRTRWIKPCQSGGVCLVSKNNSSMYPRVQKLISARGKKDCVETNWLMIADKVQTDVKVNYHFWGKTLVVDVISGGGKVSSVRYGYAVGFESPKLITLPYHTYKAQGTPAVVVAGRKDAPVFFASNTDWYLSNASEIRAEYGIEGGRVKYDFGVCYYPKTNGKRNDTYERFFLTSATTLEEVLPNIPNPVSPWKHITGKKLWRSWGCSRNRNKDYEFWYKMYRYGIREVIITDHESMWTDLDNNPESSTFRIHTDPTKGGDEAHKKYVRFLQDKLGFIYGPYNSYADITALSPYWSVDHISRKGDNQLLTTWDRCYGPKPAWILEPAEEILPKLQSIYHFSAAYCDVHTCWTPSERVDYDYRVPGAGTQSAVFYSYGELFLLEKKYFSGPVYSEGGIHWQYCGLTDGNYAQDGYYDISHNPWLVDFDVRKMHNLCCNIGMGDLDMFYCKGGGWGRSREEWDRITDRFLAATLAFGHQGYLVVRPWGAIQYPLRSYYMLQQIQSRYTQVSVDKIWYVDKDGNLLNTEQAIVSGTYKHSQVVVKYSDGTVVVSNGNPNGLLSAVVCGRKVMLPPNGYVAWSGDGKIYVYSGNDKTGHRYDYVESPAYIFIDGRGKLIRTRKAECSGI